MGTGQEDAQRAGLRSLRVLPSWGHHAEPGGRRPLTFATELKARRWLREQAGAIRAGAWPPPPPPKVVVLGDQESGYAAEWIKGRKSERTRDHYRYLLRDHIAPTFGTVPLTEITPTAVRAWHIELGSRTGPTARAHAYGLLKAVLATAESDDLIPANPCRIKGAGQAATAKQMRPLDSPQQLDALADAVPERLNPPRSSSTGSASANRAAAWRSVAISGFRRQPGSRGGRRRAADEGARPGAQSCPSWSIPGARALKPRWTPPTSQRARWPARRTPLPPGRWTPVLGALKVDPPSRRSARPSRGSPAPG